MRDIVILDGARTPIGTFGGSLANTTPIDLAASVTKAAIERAGVEPSQIGHCLLYTSPSPRDMRRSRMPSSA